MIFDKYPYSNFHELNDDWIIKTLKEFDAKLDEFIVMNSLTYADPIQYAVETTYPANMVVIYNETAYVSLKTVPAGMLPTTGGDYWLEIFPFGDLINQGVDVGLRQIDEYIQQAQDQITAAINTLPTVVNNWMEANPDVTTTVQDHSISWLKLNDNLQSVLLAGYDETSRISIDDFEQGAINIQTGADFECTFMCRTGFITFPKGITLIRTMQDLRIQVFQYALDGTYEYRVVTLARIEYQPFVTDENHKYRISISYDDYSTLTPSDLPLIPVACAIYQSEFDEINTELSYTYEVGKMIRHANGATSNSSQSNATNYVDIGGYEKIRYARVKTTQTAAPAAGMAFYDESKTYISGLVSAYNQDANGYYDCELDVPPNAKYARFTFYQDTTLGTFHVYGVEGINTAISNIEEKVDDLFASVFPKTLFNLYLLGTENGYLRASDGQLVASNVYTSTHFIDVTRFSKLFLNNGARYWFYDSSKAQLSTGNLINDTPLAGTMKELSVPSGASYFRITIPNENLTGAEYIYGDTFISDLIDAKNMKVPLTYFAIGDSITRGMYAEYGASSSSGPTDYGYPYWLGVENGYTVVNLGESGGGYASIGNQTNSNCKDIVDANAFTGADIITIAFGVNDWKNATQDVILGSMASTAGDGTVIGNMKYSIEKLYEKAPKAQLIVMLPFNTNRVFAGMDANAMTLENNWAFGYAYRHNQTLEDYRAAIRTCAEYYNVRVIDLEEILPINRLNIRYMCGDGLHPTIAFYKQMGHVLAPFVR